MAENQLLVFIGKPGAGKTTLICAAFPDETFVDVMPFLETFQMPDGSYKEDDVLRAYKHMYEYLETVKDPFIILELGTGYPEFNIERLKHLKESYNVLVYLCLASEATCWARAHERGMRHSKEGFARRMARDFPMTHKQLSWIQPSNATTLGMN